MNGFGKNLGDAFDGLIMLLKLGTALIVCLIGLVIYLLCK
jgi:hypothetical protein